MGLRRPNSSNFVLGAELELLEQQMRQAGSRWSSPGELKAEGVGGM